MTNNFKRRKSEHFDKKYRQKQKDKLLYKEMKKDGIRNYKMKLLKDKLTRSEAFFIEASLINEIPTYGNYGYNVSRETKNLKKQFKNKEELNNIIKEIKLKIKGE